MSLKGLLFFSLFGICAVGALFAPHLGVYAYLADYCIAPAQQWWGMPFANMGFRFSLILALATIGGAVLQKNRLNFGVKTFYDQEKTLILFLGVVWFLFVMSPETIGRYGSVDHPTVKFTKVVIFILLMTHVITDLKKLNGLFFVMSSVSLYLGVKAWGIPYNRFIGGRLEGVGGADFAEANFLAAFMAAMLPIVGIQFMKSKVWYAKFYYFICGAFAANTLSLCRSRGSFIGIAAGALVACVFAPKKIRKKIFVLMLIGLMGLVYVSDDFFIQRIMSIQVDRTEMDASSASRIDFWKAGARMFADHPLGIGPGNFFQTIGRYLPGSDGRDAHNTYVRCATELGIFGVTLFLVLLWQGYRNLMSIREAIDTLPYEKIDDFNYNFFGILVSTVVILACGLTITMIYTEIFWLILMLSICLKRTFDVEVSIHLSEVADDKNKFYP